MNINDIDKIYFLHLSDRYDREQWMNNQIQQISFPKDKVNIWWTCRRNISNEVSKYIPQLNHNNYISNRINTNPGIGGATFNCTFEHYSIIRTSYERGFNNILIFEDDVKFLVDLPIFNKFIELLPENYEICKFHNTIFDNQFEVTKDSTNYKEIPTLNTKIENPYSCIDCTDGKDYSSTCAYMLNRNGMKKFIELYNEDFCIADQVFLKINKVYVCNYQLVTTQDWKCKPQEYLWSDIWKLNTDQRFNQFK